MRAWSQKPHLIRPSRPTILESGSFATKPQVIAKFFFALMLIGKVASAATVVSEDVSRGYRVIHTSPQQFNSALFSPMVARSKIPKKDRAWTSRLERYFRIKDKLVEGKSVTLEILPDVPLLGTAFQESNLIKIKVTLIKQTAVGYFYDLDLNTKFNIAATMEAEPNPSGSLLIITVKHSAAETTVSSMISKTIFAMGFLASTPGEAEKQN